MQKLTEPELVYLGASIILSQLLPKDGSRRDKADMELLETESEIIAESLYDFIFGTPEASE